MQLRLTTTESGSPADPSDESLVLKLRSGQTQAGEVLVRRYYQPLMRYLQRLVGKEHLAEELHQQTWLSVLDHIESFKPELGGGGFKAWLFRIASNKATDYWRSSIRERNARQQSAHMLDDEVPHAGGHMESSEELAKLQRAIEQLPEAQRQILMLRYYGELKFVDIAKLLGCPLNTALGRMHKAMLKLKELMQNDSREQNKGK